MGSKTTLQLSGGGEIEVEKKELKRVKMLKPEYEKKKPGGKKEKGKGEFGDFGEFHRGYYSPRGGLLSNPQSSREIFGPHS